MQRKMTTLLNRSAETMEKRDHECSPIYACVKSVTADVHFAQGEYALSIEEYDLAGQIYEELFTCDNSRVLYCKERREAALAALDSMEGGE
jgi:hypothetical protein